MIDFKMVVSLLSGVRACALVGAYLQSWAFMEHQLNNAIGRAFGLDVLQTVVVTRNVQMRNKLHILDSLLHLEVFNELQRKRFLKVTKRIGELSKDRNTVAHCLFAGDSSGDGVCFSVEKAQGELRFPDTRWSAKTFEIKILEHAEIAKILRELVQLLPELKLAKFMARAGSGDALDFGALMKGHADGSHTSGLFGDLGSLIGEQSNE